MTLYIIDTTSRIAVTWRDKHTIVGFVEGPNARVALEETRPCKFTGGCCDAVKRFAIPQVPKWQGQEEGTTTTTATATIKSRYFRWVIQESYGFGSTICYIGLNIGGEVIICIQEKA